MNHRSESAERINGAARKISEAVLQAEEAGRQAKERVLDTIDAQRAPAARRLRTAAHTVRQQADVLSNATTRAANITAGKLDATADYIRSNNAHAMIDDVLDVVRKHPGSALVCAAVGGFLTARALKAWCD